MVLVLALKEKVLVLLGLGLEKYGGLGLGLGLETQSLGLDKKSLIYITDRQTDRHRPMASTALAHNVAWCLCVSMDVWATEVSA